MTRTFLAIHAFISYVFFYIANSVVSFLVWEQFVKELTVSCWTQEKKNAQSPTSYCEVLHTLSHKKEIKRTIKVHS